VVGCHPPVVTGLAATQDCILYREIRIENTLTDQNGEPVGVKEGAQGEVTV